MTARSYRCEACGGVVSIPARSGLTLEQARERHDKVCPAGRTK